MDDLEITRLCAEAMGLELLPAYPPFHVLANGTDYKGLMVSKEGYLFIQSGAYDPLHNDAQCAALVKRFKIFQNWNKNKQWWDVITEDTGHSDSSKDWNRAICTAVAKMQKEKQCKT